MKTLYWIFPCYNEEECLPVTSVTILEKFHSFINDGLITPESRVIFVDDGSKDKTWEVIRGIAEKEKEVVGLKLSRNKGHQYAVEAGLRYSYEKKADYTITMDVDLQDDVEAVKNMIEEFEKGFDVVYGVRNDRKTDSFFKKSTANSYYKIMKKLGVQLIENAADFRLISYRALGALLDYHEANLFLRGLVPQVGYPSTKVEYARLERKQGKTHYPLSKMILLAMDGMTSFSSKPLAFIGKLGIFFMIVSVLCMVVFGILNGVNVLPYSIMYYLFPFISFMTGVILGCLGLLGLYLGKINIEVKHRPHYFIQEIVGE